MIFNVTIDAEDANQNEALHKKVSAFLQKSADIKDFFHTFGNSWIVDTPIEDTKELREKFRKDFGSDANILILPIYGYYNGSHSKKLWDWMYQRNFQPAPSPRNHQDKKTKVYDDKDRIGALVALQDAPGFDDYEGADEARQAMKQVLAGIAFRRDAQRAGLTLKNGFNNMLFLGPPGVGKTSMAKTMAIALRDQMNADTKTPVYLVEAQHIVGRYAGQSVNNLKQILDEAQNGIVILDEIDAFTNIAHHGPEILQTLNTHMGNAINSPVIIGTLYGSNETAFRSANLGLSSRFRHVIRLNGYDDAALMKIFVRRLEESGMAYEPAVLDDIGFMIRSVRKMSGVTFGNAREIANIVDTVIDTISSRYMQEGTALAARTGEKFSDEDRAAFRTTFGTVRSADIPEFDHKTGLYRPRNNVQAAPPKVTRLSVVPPQPE